MKKLCKILTAFVLTFTMVSNMAPHALFASSGDLVSTAEMPDQYFRQYIADQLNKDPWSLTKDDLANFKDDININGGKYELLSDITGFTLLGLTGDNGNSIQIKNTNLSVLPKDQIAPTDYNGPDLLLSNNKVGDLSTKLVYLTPDEGGVQNVSRVGVLGLTNQKIEAPDSIAVVRYNTIGEYLTKTGEFDLAGVLKGTEGKWPVDLAIKNFNIEDSTDNGAITSDNLAVNGIINYANIRKSSNITFRGDKATAPYLSNRNPWSANITVPLTVEYKQDITVDGGQNNTYGTATLVDSKEYYGYGADVKAAIVPAIDRTTQYVRGMDEGNINQTLNGISLNVDPANSQNYILSGLTDVNHIHTKFTHIADIKNITKVETLGGKLASEAGKVEISEYSSDYSGNTSDAKGQIKVGSTKINDNASRTFTITPSNTKEYEIDQIIINGKTIPATEYAVNGITLLNGVATFTINDINADQHVEASFKLKQKYVVKTEPKVSITGTDKNIGGSFDKNDITKYPGEDETVKASADTAKGYVIETMKVYTINPDGTLKLFADITEQAKNKESYSYDVKNINANYKVEATFVSYKNIKTEVVPNKTNFNDGLDGGSITKDIMNIPLGSTETVKAEAKKNYIIDSLRILDKKDGTELINLTDKAKGQTVYEYEFKDIQQDYYVEVSFLKIHKIDTEIISNDKDNASNNGIEHGKITDNYENITAGDQRVIEIAADEGYMIHSLFIDGEEIKLEKGAKTYKKVYENINDDHVVKVSFIREYPITTEVTTPGGSISTPGIVEDGDKFVVNITPDKGYEVDFDTLKNTGGVITKNPDGSVTIVFDHVVNPEDIKVGFKKIVEPTPAPTPEKPAPKPEKPTGDTTSTLPLAGLAVASLIACGIVLKKRKSNIK